MFAILTAAVSVGAMAAWSEAKRQRELQVKEKNFKYELDKKNARIDELDSEIEKLKKKLRELEERGKSSEEYKRELEKIQSKLRENEEERKKLQSDKNNLLKKKDKLQKEKNINSSILMRENIQSLSQLRTINYPNSIRVIIDGSMEDYEDVISTEEDLDKKEEYSKWKQQLEKDQQELVTQIEQNNQIINSNK